MSNRVHWNGGQLAGCGLVAGLVLLSAIVSMMAEMSFNDVLVIGLFGAGCWFFYWLVRKIIGSGLDAVDRYSTRAQTIASKKASVEQAQRKLADIKATTEEKERLRAKEAEELAGLLAMIHIAADGKIPGWRIAKRIRLITTDNYEAKDNPELVFLRHVKAAGGNGVINMHIHDRAGRFISIRGQAVEVVKTDAHNETRP
jgi:hypothetical protein